jgi:cathepsin L
MRAIFVALVLLLAIVESRRGPSWQQLPTYSFEAFTRDFGRRYAPGTDEFAKRKANFEANVADAIAHNSNPSNSWKKGINQFSDWSFAEFKNYNKLRMNHQKRASYPVFKANAVDASTASPYPKFVDWRKNTAPRVVSAVKNQGACGNCWGHSATETMESQFALLTGQLPTLSVQQITSCTMADYGCGGGDFFDGWAYVQNSTGLNEQWVYPFVNFFAANESMQATAPCKNITKEFLPNFPWYPKATVTNITALNSNDANAMVAALATVGPQSIAVAASLWMSYEGGVYTNPDNGTNPACWEIDHAVQVVGYGFDFDSNQNYWIVRNSWGTEWGEQGYIRLAKPDQEPCGIDIAANATVCGTSGMLCCGGFPNVATVTPVNP